MKVQDPVYKLINVPAEMVLEAECEITTLGVTSLTITSCHIGNGANRFGAKVGESVRR